MPETPKLNHPWLVAVWPGMGGVAISAGYYMMAKLGMHLIAEFSPQGLFEVEYVEVKGGLIRTGPLPRNRWFAWTDPEGKRDIVVFIGEAQPPVGKYAFCRNLVEYGRQLGVERVFTFAAMATEMHPEHPSRVFGAATDKDGLDELKRLEIELLEDGQIGGLNGVLLGAAAEGSICGTCLLGEMPHIFAHLPFPKASLAVLEVFKTIAGIQIDMTELSEQARIMEQRLGEVLAQVEESLEQRPLAMEQEPGMPSPEERKLHPDDEERIEQLFEQAQRDRSKAYELKRELDRLGVFKDYEDRFLDLFRKSGT
ncbi:MAG TPA: PAC2 family protein [Gemmataceae bacterium]|nr:PAC2 family protein [Gemmataceae bacterium]